MSVFEEFMIDEACKKNQELSKACENMDRLRKQNNELLAVAKAFVSWADDCWGSWAINDDTTPETVAQYKAAKAAIAKAEAGKKSEAA